MIFVLFVLCLSSVLFGTHRFLRPRPKHTKPIHVSPVAPTFDWRSCDAYYLRPFKGKKSFNPSMGVRNIASDRDQLFLIEKSYLETTNFRRECGEEFEDKLMHCHDSPRSVAALKEFYSMSVAFLVQRYPMYFRHNEQKNVVANLINNDTFPYRATDEHPKALLKILLGNLEEDILIMLKDDPSDESQEYILRGSLTGSPAGFDPSHNFDKPISSIHEPVPQYASRLSSPMHRFFNKLRPEDLWMRGNWSVQTNDVLFKLEDHHGRSGDDIKELAMADIDFDNACFLRCERQVLTRLPRSGAVIMLVRTYLTPIKDVRAEGLGPELAHAIESLPDDLAFYKRRRAWGKAVCEYLRMETGPESAASQ